MTTSRHKGGGMLAVAALEKWRSSQVVILVTLFGCWGRLSGRWGGVAERPQLFKMRPCSTCGRQMSKRGALSNWERDWIYREDLDGNLRATEPKPNPWPHPLLPPPPFRTARQALIHNYVCRQCCQQLSALLSENEICSSSKCVEAFK